jgi:galactose-6-phosphate isomerase
MPLLDMSDVLTDPDFLDSTLVCQRQNQTVGTDGRAINTPTSIPFSGVVTAAGGQTLQRRADGEYERGRISIVSKFKLIAGQAGLTADIVAWNGNTYTVVQVDDYSNYGAGFTQAICELIDLTG